MIHNRLVLIDSFALIFRAFYGIPAGLTHAGHPINAAYGFTSALLAAIKELQPEYLVACFDLPKPTKRHEQYVEYKATRKPMPDDLVPQIQYCKEVLKAMNIPIVSAEGYEGEDVIATIVAKQSAIRNPQSAVGGELLAVSEFIIVTGDMDTLQLIDERTKVYSMARGAKQAELLDTMHVKMRYGLTPAQFVDFKALKGDASDNIPGVPGVGEKTACKLVQDYGSLDKIYENIEKINGKLKTLLSENKDQAYLSQKLSKIDNQAPIEFNLPDAKVHDYDLKKVIKLFTDLGFKSLIPRLPAVDKADNRLSLF